MLAGKFKSMTMLLITLFIGAFSLPIIADEINIQNFSHTLHGNLILSKNAKELKPLQQRPALDMGVFLIAARNLNDPNFSKTVILITDYNETGTAGLIINRQTTITIDQAIPQLAEFNTTTQYLNFGGPVAINNLSLLVQTDINLEPPNTKQIFSDVYLINATEFLSLLSKESQYEQNFRLYLGYAGWAAGQLESELLRGDWYIWHANAEVIFNMTIDSIWHELIKLVTAKWVMR